MLAAIPMAVQIAVDCCLVIDTVPLQVESATFGLCTVNAEAHAKAEAGAAHGIYAPRASHSSFSSRAIVHSIELPLMTPCQVSAL